MMCLSKVFEKDGSSEHMLLNNIQKFTFDDGGIIFTDLLERDTRIEGKLVSADLVNGKVVIDTSV